VLTTKVSTQLRTLMMMDATWEQHRNNVDDHFATRSMPICCPCEAKIVVIGRPSASS